MTPETQAFNRKLSIVLRRARLDANVSQADLAFRIGVTPQQVSKYERGIDSPDVYRLVLISGVLGRHYATLMAKALAMRDAGIGERRYERVSLPRRENG